MTTVEFRSSVEIGNDLRRVIHAARTAPERWPGGRMTQEEAARRIGKSPVWYRKIENGGTVTASVTTVCDICQVLGIDPSILKILGYHDLADELDARQEMGQQVVVNLDELDVLTEDERRALGIILAKMGSRERKAV